jgi:hypothetical protein
VPEIIEPHIGVPAATAIFLEKQSLGAGHVGAKTAEEHNPRTATGELLVGDCCPIVTW